jgi:hypothetical protein
VRNIRDTNWLKYSFNREGCWNMKPEATLGAGETCSGAKLIDAGNYAVDLDTEGYKWGLTSVGDVLDLATAENDEYRLYTETASGGELYVSNTIANSTGDAGKYFREVKIEYIGSGVDKETAEQMKVTSRVQWKLGTRVNEIEMVSYLTNYRKVKTTP